ncbi:MAG: DUF3793 family protein [Lachnospiraceae bacterium]
MPIQEIIQLNTLEDGERKAALMLAIHCAPVLNGSKAANIMTVTWQEFCRIRYLLEGTVIRYRFLRIRGGKGILLLYRKKEIEDYLHLEDNQTFLKGFGYHSGSIADMLNQLSERIDSYNCNKIIFPHEIGVFLEYPLHDVKGFLANDGKNYAYSGYWKVYQDVQGAMQKFKRYDEDRDYAIRAVTSGKTIREIASGE